MSHHSSANKRSFLLTPALRPDRYQRALTCGAATSLIDIEDSVAREFKTRARKEAQRFFDIAADGDSTRGIRVNALTTRDGLLDLIEISRWEHKPDAILIPKVEAARDIDIVSAVLDGDGYTPHLYALIETPRAIAAVSAIASHQRLTGLGFGAADYGLRLGGNHEWGPLSYARSALVNAALEHNKIAIDSPFFNLAAPEELRNEADTAKSWGFYGKGAVHPDQIPIIDAAFAPTDDEVRFARAVIAEADRGPGIAAVGGRMVGAPFIAAARTLVNEQAEIP